MGKCIQNARNHGLLRGAEGNSGEPDRAPVETAIQGKGRPASRTFQGEEAYGAISVQRCSALDYNHAEGKVVSGSTCYQRHQGASRLHTSDDKRWWPGVRSRTTFKYLACAWFRGCG